MSALVNNKIVANSGSYRADFFAQVGQLRLSDKWALEIIGETFGAPVPTVSLTPPTTTIPLDVLKLTTFQSIGFRLSVTLSGPSMSTDVAASDAFISACISYRQNHSAPDPDTKKNCKTVGVDVDAPEPTDKTEQDEDDRWAFAMAQERAARGLTLMAGARLLYAGNETNPGGVASELALQYLSSGGGGFLSGADTYLSKAQDTAGSTIIQTERLNELKIALGAHLQFHSQVSGSEIAPRAGIYLSTSWNWWTNQFAVAGADPHIRGFQFEGAVYASGHFSGGFAGLIAFSVLQPYGHDAPLEYVISIAPTFGAPTTSAGTN